MSSKMSSNTLTIYAIPDLERAPKCLSREDDTGRYTLRLTSGQVQKVFLRNGCLFLFTIGSWEKLEDDATISFRVESGDGVHSMDIGTIAKHNRCFCWEGSFSPEIIKVLRLKKAGSAARLVAIINSKPGNRTDPVSGNKRKSIDKTETSNLLTQEQKKIKTQTLDKYLSSDQIVQGDDTVISDNMIKKNKNRLSDEGNKCEKSANKIGKHDKESQGKSEVNSATKTILDSDSPIAKALKKDSMQASPVAEVNKIYTTRETKAKGKKEVGKKESKRNSTITSDVDSTSNAEIKPSEPTTPVLVVKRQVGQGEKRRARMGKTPESNTPKKRKPPIRSTSSKKMVLNYEFNDKENSGKESNAGSTKSSDEMSNSNIVVAVKKEGATPTRRWGHTLCMINENHAVLIGGQGDKQQISKDAIWTLEISRNHWRHPDTKVAQGQKPEARMGHTAVYDPTVRSIYVFGGSKNLRWFNDVHALDIDEWKWELIKTNGKAPTRAYHSANLFRHDIWIFGGVYPQPDPQPDGSSNDVHVFSPIEESWYQPIVMGDKPIARSGHSSSILEDQLVIFGGWDYPVVYNDLHILDLVTMHWQEPKCNGTPPKPRSWHASCVLSGNRVLIHGGYDGDLALDDSFIFNMDTFSWTEVSMGSSLLARCGHTAFCLPFRYDNKENKDEVFLFGGGDNDGSFFDDLIILNLPVTCTTSSCDVLSDSNDACKAITA